MTTDVVPTVQDDGAWTCHHEGCDERIGRDKVLCKAHFYEMPAAVQHAIIDGLFLRQYEKEWGCRPEDVGEALAAMRHDSKNAHEALDSTGAFEGKGWTLFGKASKVAEVLSASQARERVIDKELMETKEALEDANRLFAQAVDESAEKDHTIGSQKDQLAKARAQTEADVDERVQELERALEGAQADAKTQTLLREGMVEERNRLLGEVDALREERDALRIEVDAWIKECRRRRPHDPDLLAEVRTLLLTHGETLEAAGAEHVYYLHWRVSQALEGAGR